MIHVFPDKIQMSAAAAFHAASTIRRLLSEQPSIRLVAATGASQLLFLQQLGKESQIDWSRVELFHLDEYIGIGQDHAASFARYIRERIIEPFGISRYHLLDGKRFPVEVIDEANMAISQHPVDLAFVGIGENGHLAFNDPPADFNTEQPYLLVELDEACRRQQVNEGWFPTLEDVPQQAISMSIRQILKSREIICVVPGPQKAKAVQGSLEGPVSPQVPASILRTHSQVTVFLDSDAASQLRSHTQPSRADHLPL
jgi:glucosamine-6-phosphate deaminase